MKMRYLISAAALLAAPLALAHPHPEAGLAHGALHGFTHPFAGLDHLLAMVAVGLWAAQKGGRAVWALPVGFLLAMAIGGALGVAGMPLPAVEFGIAGSVLIFGLLLLAAPKVPLAMGVAITGAFALFHGHAHGTEMVHGLSGLSYGAGFIAATALLHGIGIAAAQLVRLGNHDKPLRIAGSAIAAVGAVLVVGLV